jgi:HSP20 family protein
MSKGMSWRYNRKKKDEDDEEGFFQDPFGFGFRTGFQDLDQMIDSLVKSAESLGNNSVYYGYQANIGPDGKPHVREFGNLKPTRRGTFELGSREPFVDVVENDKEQTLKVVAEMPGVQKENIELQATEDSLTIKAKNHERNYETSVPLERAVLPDSAKASYRNGVLEVVLKTKEAPQPKGTNIKVE